MSFLDELEQTEGGEVSKNYVPRFTDPIEAGRFHFAKNSRIAIDEIKNGTLNKDGVEAGHWWKKKDGKYQITFKNGITLMELAPKKTFYILASVDKACEFIAKAAIAAEKGEFDPVFKTTARKSSTKPVKSDADNVIDALKAKQKV
jgi:hypothetical protein